MTARCSFGTYTQDGPLHQQDVFFLDIGRARHGELDAVLDRMRDYIVKVGQLVHQPIVLTISSALRTDFLECVPLLRGLTTTMLAERGILHHELENWSTGTTYALFHRYTADIWEFEERPVFF